MQQHIEMWINALNEKANNPEVVHHLPDRQIKYILVPGTRYTKVVRDEFDINSYLLLQRHVHAFIENATGDIYKAASWKSPARNGARFNVVNDIENLLQVCDPYGSYLYKR